VHRYRVWQWNVAGDTLHHGSVSDGLISAAVASIVRSGSQVATVNELCRQQFEALQAGLVAAGWPQNADDFAAFQPTVRGVSSVCQGQDFGNALFSIAMLGTVDRVTLPSDGSGEQRGLLCAALQDLPAMRFCTTHITPSGAPSVDGVPANVRQLEAVRHRLDRYHRAGDTVVIAGDFNAQPDYARLDDWYAPAVHGPANGHNTGAYRELDDTDGRNCPGYGEWTATGPPGAAPPCGNGGKIDMIFVREDAIAGSYRADALKIPTTCHGVPAKPSVYAAGSCSAHRILAGHGPVQVRTPAAATRRSAAGMR